MIEFVICDNLMVFGDVSPTPGTTETFASFHQPAVERFVRLHRFHQESDVSVASLQTSGVSGSQELLETRRLETGVWHIRGLPLSELSADTLLRQVCEDYEGKTAVAKNTVIRDSPHSSSCLGISEHAGFFSAERVHGTSLA